MDGANPLLTPMITSHHLSKNWGEPIFNDKQYKSIFVALQFVTITRPKISFSANKLCQFMQEPKDEYWKAVKMILRYLKGTIDHGLSLKACRYLSTIGYTDAD